MGLAPQLWNLPVIIEAMMKYRMLGNTGLLVSEIGFGSWGIGGAQKGAVAYGPTNDQESLRALHYAYDQGITFYDTADFYGFGHSERLLGKAFKSIRQQVIIASKGGMISASGQGNYNPEYLRRALELTLARLQTDYIDLYQLHGPALNELDHYDDILKFFETFQKEGKIRAYGISVRSPQDGIAVIQKFHCPCIQINFSLMDQRALDHGLFPLCVERQVGVIARTPLCFGYLTSEYTGGETFPASDHRSRWNRANVEKWVLTNKRFISLIPQNGRWSSAQFALQYCLSFDSISTAIPGMLSERHVAENGMASECDPIPPDVLAEIRKIYEQNRNILAV